MFEEVWRKNFLIKPQCSSMKAINLANKLLDKDLWDKNFVQRICVQKFCG